ncbi:hypothetical protein ACYG9Z_01150 [Mesorhizobium sp. RSR380A]|uniref:hypothetical protein n=1 Tax=Mesorhizobium sp. LNJC380A00 TaxID=1287264 RepID=UPI0003CDD083|nr:hypothetical protein [Mesorhizobium sp. LNJC380A00]ESY49547.1 hypothetical protein X746_04325 [Mesorhizobium sp. LNJC380A00]
MSKPLQRATLEAGLKLDINRLIRNDFLRPGSYWSSSVTWTDSYYDEPRATATISADMSSPEGGWFEVRINNDTQRIPLWTMSRHFGGRQWYFACPRLHVPVSVLWMPPGAVRFASKRHWGRQAAYQSQFLDQTGRAHRGQAKIRRRLCSIGSFDPDEWDFPPKPKWMRQRTYEEAEVKFDHYEDILDIGTCLLMARLTGLI